jgi:prephenate dehydrogenase
VSARVGIAGLGLIGGSLLRGLVDSGERATGFDPDPEAAGGARREGFTVVPSLEDLARGSDVVFVCAPPAAAAGAVASVLQAAGDVVVADATSFKARVIADVRTAAPDAIDRFVPAHPLAGGQASGWEATRPDLLREAFWAVCPVAADAPAEPLCAVAAVLDALDSRLVVCDAADHDDALARTSHVPHLAAQALVHLAGDRDAPLRAALSGGGFRDTTRIAESDPRLWAQIIGANGAPALAALDELLERLRGLREAVAEGDEAALEAAWTQGRELRRVVERVRWSRPEWTPETAPWPAWDRLLELGRAGRPVRRLRPARDGAEVEYEVAAGP